MNKSDIVRSDRRNAGTKQQKENKSTRVKPKTDSRSTDTRNNSSAAPAVRKVRNLRESAEFFGEQYCSTVDLEPPENLLRLLAMAVVEVMAGVRNINQLGSLLSEDVYLRLRERSIKVAQERARRGEATKAPNLTVADVHVEHTRDGVVESVVLVHSPSRTRAVTIRLEGVNRRWRAQSVAVISRLAAEE